jgi:hypothetical protein
VVGYVFQPTAHEALERSQGVLRIMGLVVLRYKTDLPRSALQIPNNRRQYNTTLLIWQALGHSMPDGCHQRVSGAQVDSNGNSPLMGVWRLARFRDL